MRQEYYYGACLYPEVWDESVFDEDIKHMKKIGMNFTRIGEFIWANLEPEEDLYDFTLLIKSLDKILVHDIKVVVCIPTPTPPRWMTYQHKERLLKNRLGEYLSHGSRQHICTDDPYFRKKANQLAQKIAEICDRYPNVVGIQLDNEFKAHADLLFNDITEKKWYQWLKDKYHTIENLNKAWGTNIWSERYNSFEEVVLPVTTPFIHNSSLSNDFISFTHDQLTDFVKSQVKAIRSKTKIPITHNSALGFNINNYEIFSLLDFTSFDTYAAASNYPAFTLNLDYWRNMNENPHFMLMETSTSHAGHIESYGNAHPSDYLLTEIFLTYACGGVAFNYWHFRGHTHGCEQPHSSVLTSWGEPGTGYKDVVEGGKLLQAIRPIIEESVFVPSKTAIVYSDIAKRYMQVESGRNYDYRSLLTDFYSSFIHRGIGVEVIPEQRDFSEYDVVFIPYCHYINEELYQKIMDFVEKGGICVMGPMTSDRTKDHAWPTNHGLEKMGRELAVAEVEQFDVTNRHTVGRAFGEKESLVGMSTFFKVDKSKADSLGTVLNDKISGKDWFFSQNFGNGELIYLGSLPEKIKDSKIWTKFLEKYISEKSLSIPDGVIVYSRVTFDGKNQFWIANMKDKCLTITLTKKMRILYSNFDKQKIGNNTLNLEAFGLVILEEK